MDMVAIRAVVFILLMSRSAASINPTTMVIAPYVTAGFRCTGPYNDFPPSWLLDGKGALTVGECYNYTLMETGDGNGTATLLIHGNSTCDTFNISCRIYKESHFSYLHNITLEIEVGLASPESVRQVNSSSIEWNPPYYSVNNDVIGVDPHITQYTVYITDIYTGNIIVKENVTGTQFTLNLQSDFSCPMYQVSAWNAGGEGEKSQPVQESTTQVPRNVTAWSITAEVSVDHVVHIHIDNVDTVCTNRMPEFFLITLINSAGSVFNETRQHQPGEVADFTISLPQSVDVCSLHVRIRAGNSAGMSSPSEAVEVGCSSESTESPTTSSTGGGSSRLPKLLTVIAALCVVVIVVIAVVTICYKIYKRRNRKGHNSAQSSDHDSESPSHGGQVPLNEPPEDVARQQNTTISRPDPESTAVWMDSAPSTGISTESGHSDDHE